MSDDIKKFYEENPFPKDKIMSFLDVNHHSWIINCIPKELKPKLGSEELIIDVGCGTGSISYYLSQYGKVVGIDFSEESIKQAKKNLPVNNNITFHNLDITKNHLLFNESKKPKYIFCIGVLHHIPEVDEAIKNIKEMMSEETLLIISVYNKYLQKIKNKDKEITKRRNKGYNESWIQDGYNHPFIRMHNHKEFINDIKRWDLEIIGEWRKMPDWMRRITKKGAMMTFCVKKRI